MLSPTWNKRCNNTPQVTFARISIFFEHTPLSLRAKRGNLGGGNGVSLRAEGMAISVAGHLLMSLRAEGVAISVVGQS